MDVLIKQELMWLDHHALLSSKHKHLLITLFKINLLKHLQWYIRTNNKLHCFKKLNLLLIKIIKYQPCIQEIY